MATNPLAGQLIRAGDMFSLITFTPTFTASLTLGAGGVSEGWYQQIGQYVLWGMRIEFGTSPAFTASVLMNLPVSAYTGGGASLAATVGEWGMRSASGVNFGGPAVTNDSAGTQCRFTGAWDGTSPKANVGTTSGTPATPASGNVFSATGSYRAA